MHSVWECVLRQPLFCDLAFSRAYCLLQREYTALKSYISEVAFVMMVNHGDDNQNYVNINAEQNDWPGITFSVEPEDR